MFFYSISAHLLPILVSAFAPLVIGFVWYHPAVFGTRWMKLVGVTEDTMKAQKPNMTKQLAVSYVLSVVMATVLLNFIFSMIVVSVVSAIILASTVWVGFVVTVQVINNMYELKPLPTELLVINLGYYLASLVVMSVMLALWV